MTTSKSNVRRVQRFIPPPLPDALKSRLDPELRCIVRMFQSSMASMPAELFGAVDNPIRAAFVDRQVHRWMARGPKCLTCPTVGFLLNTGFRDHGIIVPPGQDFVKVFTGIVSDGLTKGLHVVLREIEQTTVAVSDDYLYGLGLSEDSIEVFHRLLPSFSGTLDELLAAAATL